MTQPIPANEQFGTPALEIDPPHFEALSSQDVDIRVYHFFTRQAIEEALADPNARSVSIVYHAEISPSGEVLGVQTTNGPLVTPV